MLTLNAAGKSGNDAVDFIRSSLSVDENELKILIDGPAQSDAIKKFLEAQGFNNIFPEDDDGALYLVASKVDEQEEEEENEVPPVKVPERYHEENNSCGVLVSCDTGKQKFMFLKKFISSLTKTQTKPDVIALVNSAVKLLYINAASFLMQSVNILCNYSLKAAALFQLFNNFVRFIGFGFVHTGKENFFHFFPTALRVCIEKIQFNKFWVIFIPQTARTGERGNAAFYRHTRSGKHYATFGRFNQFNCFVHICYHIKY